MFDISLFLVYFCLIACLQSAIGVGILVLGTPFLLILGYNIVEIFFFLLPLSIATSFVNLILMKKTINFKRFSNQELIKFFKICTPSIIVGLILIKYFQDYINFNYLVSLFIIFSVLFMIFKEKIKFKINFFRISILSIVGLMHGLTNSGGTLMSLALSTNKEKNSARFNITFFYLILASVQYFITVVIFYEKFLLPDDFKIYLMIILGIIIGNILNKLISYTQFRITLNALALLSSFLLFIFS